MDDINISTNMGIDVFKSNIANTIATSQLPVGVIYYVLKDVFNEIQDLYKEVIIKEQQELINSTSENKEEDIDNKEN